jgi:hypothetical protein
MVRNGEGLRPVHAPPRGQAWSAYLVLGAAGAACRAGAGDAEAEAAGRTLIAATDAQAAATPPERITVTNVMV